jgi:hypothetical protein
MNESCGKFPFQVNPCPSPATLTESAWCLSEKGARLCRRPATARGKLQTAPKVQGMLRLVKNDAAALRNFQTRSQTAKRKTSDPAAPARSQTHEKMTSATAPKMPLRSQAAWRLCRRLCSPPSTPCPSYAGLGWVADALHPTSFGGSEKSHHCPVMLRQMTALL